MCLQDELATAICVCVAMHCSLHYVVVVEVYVVVVLCVLVVVLQLLNIVGFFSLTGEGF